MVKLKHGDIIWIDLMPYVDLRVRAKYIDYHKALNSKIKIFGTFDAQILIYSSFYTEKSYLKSKINLNDNLLCHSVLCLWAMYAKDNILVVDREKIVQSEVILQDFRRIPNSPHILSRPEFTDKEKFAYIYYDQDYEILTAEDGLPYKNIGMYPIEKCKHLDYNDNIGSLYFLRSRIYLEYLKMYKPNELKYDLFGKLPEYLANPDNGGDDRHIYTKYAKMPLLNSVQKSICLMC